MDTLRVVGVIAAWLLGGSVLIYLWLQSVGFLLEKFGSKEGSCLETLAAIHFAGLVVPFMPFILIGQWAKSRRAGHADRPTNHPPNRVRG